MAVAFPIRAFSFPPMQQVLQKREPLNVADDATFDAWLLSNDTRTLEEFAAEGGSLTAPFQPPISTSGELSPATKTLIMMSGLAAMMIYKRK